MLKPNKHTDPELTVLHVSSLIIRRLKRTQVKSFDELRNIVHDNDSRNDPLFLPSLQLLYILGLIEYHPKNDSIEYIGSNETK